MIKTVSWSTKSALFPAGTIAGVYRVIVSGPSVQTQDTDGTAPVLFDLPAGEYSAVVQRLDVNGVELGSASVSFTVTEPQQVAIDIPDTITVS